MTKMCVRRVLTLANPSSHLELRHAIFKTLQFKLEFFIFAWPLILGSPGFGAHLCQAQCPRITLPSCRQAPPFLPPYTQVLAAFHLQWPGSVQTSTLPGITFIPTLRPFLLPAFMLAYQLTSKKSFKDVVSCCLENQDSIKSFPLKNVHYLILCITFIAGV